MQVFVRDNNIDQALRILKKKMQREGVFREMKRRRFYEKPSTRATREKGEAVRRARKQARKKAVREGLIAAPPKKIEAGRRGVAPHAGAAPRGRFGSTREPEGPSRFGSRTDDQPATGARAVSATPASPDRAGAAAKA